MFRRSSVGVCFAASFVMLAVSSSLLSAQTSEQAHVNPPFLPQAEPPAASLTVDELEERGDQLRSEKAYFDAIDYYRVAISKSSSKAKLYNKAGICELLTQHYTDAGKDFERAIHADRKYADAYNNMGVVEYESKKYNRALSLYTKAIKLAPYSASFYSNQGAALFARKDFDKANESYMKAMQLDPDIFERNSHNGVSAQLPSALDRAHYDYAIARLYARLNEADRSLQYLRRALEEGYTGIDEVYKDHEFASLRKDPRFAELMNKRPVAIQQ